MLLIGGNGFIGRHLSIAALSQGYDLDIVSRNADESFLKTKGLMGNFYDLSQFSNTVGDGVIRKNSKIIYLASKSTPGTFNDEPWKEFDCNVIPLFQFLDRLSRLNPTAHFVYISSGGTVYGNTDLDWISEKTQLRPISSYGLGKVIAEEVIQYYHTTRGLNHTILRVANPVGRYHKNIHQGLIPAIFRSILLQHPLSIFGDGNQIRDYLNADDLAEAILIVFGHGNIPSRTWNVGSGSGHSTLSVIEMCSRILGKSPILDHRSKREFDVERMVLDCSDFQNAYNWRANIPLSLTIEKIWQAIQESESLLR